MVQLRGLETLRNDVSSAFKHEKDFCQLLKRNPSRDAALDAIRAMEPTYARIRRRTQSILPRSALALSRLGFLRTGKLILPADALVSHHAPDMLATAHGPAYALFHARFPQWRNQLFELPTVRIPRRQDVVLRQLDALQARKIRDHDELMALPDSEPRAAELASKICLADLKGLRLAHEVICRVRLDRERMESRVLGLDASRQRNALYEEEQDRVAEFRRHSPEIHARAHALLDAIWDFEPLRKSLSKVRTRQLRLLNDAISDLKAQLEA